MQTCLKTGSAEQQGRLVEEIVANVRDLIGD